MHKLLFVLAAVATVAGGYFVWRAWENAACPSKDEVVEARMERTTGPPWPERLRVGEWLFFDGQPTERNDRIFFQSAPPAISWHTPFPGTKVIARPATAMARLRLRIQGLLEYALSAWTRAYNDPPAYNDPSVYYTDPFAGMGIIEGIIEIDPTQSPYRPGPNPRRSIWPPR